jgi:hypothetical protein
MAGAHDKLIANAAKTALQPLGLRRKGQSRLWIGDHGWWLAVVEFQPSGFEKGSYLNVAAHWLWSAKGYISFDLGCGADGGIRVADFEAYDADEPFNDAATRLATAAATGVHELVAQLPSITATADLLLDRAGTSPVRGSWPTYHAGVAAGLAGRADEAATMLSSVTDTRVIDAAQRYIDLAFDSERFRALAISLIASQREALRLPTANAELF